MSDLTARLRLSVEGAQAVAGDLGKVEAELRDVGAAAGGAAAGAAKVGPALDKAGASAKGAASDFATMFDAYQSDFVSQYQAGASRFIQTSGAVGKTAKLTSNEMLNLSRQFADVGVTAAMGMNPLMIFIQQGPQLAETFATASARGITFTGVLRAAGGAALTALTPIAPLLLGIGAAVAVVAGGFALFERAVDKQTKHATTFGDTWKAVVEVTGKAIMDGPIGDGLKALSGLFSAAMDAIANGAVTFLTRYVGFWGAAYNAVVKNWRNLPEAFAAIVQGAANVTLRNLEGLINASIGGLNKLLKAANLGEIGKVSLGQLALVRGKIVDDFAADEKRIADKFKASLKNVFGDIVTAADRSAAARDKAKKAAKGHAEATDDEAKALKELDRALKQLIESLETPAERAVREFREKTQLLRAGLNLGRISVDQFREALDRLNPTIVSVKDAQKALSVEFLSTPASLSAAIDDMAVASDRASDLTDTLYDLADAVDAVASGLKSGNLAQAFQGLARGSAALGAPAGLTAALGQVSAFAALAQAINPPIAKALGMDRKQQRNAGNFGLIPALLLGKSSNHGAGISLTPDSTGSFSGGRRNEETEQAALSAANSILAGQKLLRDAGLTLGATVNGLVIGTRDLSQIYLTNGRTVTAAVGDVGAAAEAALSAVLEGATYVSDAQKSLVDGMLAAGKGFEAITAALEGYAQAQGLGQSVEDAILKLTDPKAFAFEELARAQKAERDGLKAAADAGYLTAEQFAAIGTRLGVLEGLQLDALLTSFAESVSTATDTLRAQAADLSGSVNGRILELTDPDAFKVRRVNDEIDAKIAQARPLIDAGVLGAEFLDQLESLRGLELGALFGQLTDKVTETVDVFAQVRPQLQKWLDQLAVGPSAELSPKGQRAVAVEQYQRQLARARSGDAEALSSLTSYADQALSADRNATSSASARLAFANQVRADIAGLTGLSGAGANPTVAAIAGLQTPLATIAQASAADLAATASGGKPVVLANLPSIQAMYGGALTAQTDRLVAANDRSREEIVAGLKATSDRLAQAIDTLASHVGDGLAGVAAAAIEGNAAVQAAVAELAGEQRLTNLDARLRGG